MAQRQTEKEGKLVHAHVQYVLQFLPLAFGKQRLGPISVHSFSLERGRIEGQKNWRGAFKWAIKKGSETAKSRGLQAWPICSILRLCVGRQTEPNPSEALECHVFQVEMSESQQQPEPAVRNKVGK